MKKIIIAIIGGLILVGVLFFGQDYYSYLKASLTYQNQTQEISQEGFGNSLALNNKGEPILSFISKEKLIFKERENNIFKEEIVSQNALAGNQTKIAVDNKGKAYILYITKENTLMLAKKEDGDWSFEKVFSSAALDCNLLIDENNVIYVSFWSPKEGLVFGKKQNEKWDIELIDYGKVGWWNSLAIDKNKNPHLSYFDFENKALLYLFFDGLSWQKEVVDKKGEVGYWNALLVDQKNNPLISYFDQTSGNLKFAQKTEGGWKVEVVDKDGVVGERTNITLDKNQNPVISYVGLSDNSFRLAKKTNQGWQVIMISSNREATDKKIKGEGSLDNSIVLGGNGILHLLWHDLFGEKLNYLESSF